MCVCDLEAANFHDTRLLQLNIGFQNMRDAPHTPYRVDGCSVKGAVQSLHLDKVSKVPPLLHLVPVSMCCHHSLASKSSRISMALVSMEMAGSPGDGSVMLKSKSPRCAASTSVRAAVHACSGVDRLSF